MTSPVYLITGPSGSGKTAVSDYLTEQGYVAIDADSAPGLCYFVNKNNKPVPYPAQKDANWWENNNYVWELDRLKKLLENLDTTSGPVFLCGNAGNIAKAWDLFAAVYYLDIPSDTIPARIAGAARDRSFGQRINDTNQLIRWAEPFKAEMIEHGAIVIDATKPVKTVATDIIAQTKVKTAK